MVSYKARCRKGILLLPNLTMKSCEDFYTLMLKAFELCSTEHNELEKVECCYLRSVTYTSALIKTVQETGFATDQEKVVFFKDMLPRFGSHAAYYRLLYNALLFEPDEQEAAKHFWLREREKAWKALREYSELKAYLQSGCTDRDVELFGDVDLKNAMEVLMYCKRHERVENRIAELLALEMYTGFIENALTRD